MHRRNLLTTLLVLLPILSACQQPNSGSSNSSVTNGTKKEILIGLIPAESKSEIEKQFDPMRAYLQKKLGIPVKIFAATNYAGVVEAMSRDKIDVAWFGPLSYVLAEKEAGAEAFAVGVRKSNGKSTYKSIYVVSGDSNIKSIQDLKGKNVAFVSPTSTSGGLVPTYLIKKETGKMPEEFFGKLIYAGGHDAAELAVKNKTVDAAADSDITYNKMLKNGQITKESNRIIAESEPLPGLPLAYRKELDPSLKQKIKDAFLNAHKDIQVTGYGELLRYEEAKSQDYKIISDMIQELGLQRQDVLK